MYKKIVSDLRVLDDIEFKINIKKILLFKYDMSYGRGVETYEYVINIYKESDNTSDYTFQERLKNAIGDLLREYNDIYESDQYLTDIIYLVGLLNIISAYETIFSMAKRRFKISYSDTINSAGKSIPIFHILLHTLNVLSPPEKEKILESFLLEKVSKPFVDYYPEFFSSCYQRLVMINPQVYLVKYFPELVSLSLEGHCSLVDEIDILLDDYEDLLMECLINENSFDLQNKPKDRLSILIAFLVLEKECDFISHEEFFSEYYIDLTREQFHCINSVRNHIQTNMKDAFLSRYEVDIHSRNIASMYFKEILTGGKFDLEWSVFDYFKLISNNSSVMYQNDKEYIYDNIRSMNVYFKSILKSQDDDVYVHDYLRLLASKWRPNDINSSLGYLHSQDRTVC